MEVSEAIGLRVNRAEEVEAGLRLGEVRVAVLIVLRAVVPPLVCSSALCFVFRSMCAEVDDKLDLLCDGFEGAARAVTFPLPLSLVACFVLNLRACALLLCCEGGAGRSDMVDECKCNCCKR